MLAESLPTFSGEQLFQTTWAYAQFGHIPPASVLAVIAAQAEAHAGGSVARFVDAELGDVAYILCATVLLFTAVVLPTVLEPQAAAQAGAQACVCNG